jgi:hypothetical protein
LLRLRVEPDDLQVLPDGQVRHGLLISAGAPLDSVNDAFHEAYDQARADAEHEAPVFVVIEDTLVVFHRGKRRDHSITPRLFHVIKSVAHAPVALFAALQAGDAGALDGSTRARIVALREHVVAALASLADEGEPAEETDHNTIDDLRVVLDSTLAFAERALSDASTTMPSEAVEAFARDTGPWLLRLTAHATRVQLAALDACVADALRELSEGERRQLHVVVTGDHQARVRSLGMQYFQKRFGEEEGTEARVAYAEGVTDADEALALVGRRRLDAAIARAFFGDAKRLQRDVLGDAVHDLLARTELAPIR